MWERKNKVQERKIKNNKNLERREGRHERKKERKTFIFLCRGLCLFRRVLPWQVQWTCGYYSMTPL
jgi:hypothetical protein